MRRVAFQGEPGAFSEAAARRLWPDAAPVPVRRFADVVDAVERGEVDAGVLPVRNAIVGPVTPALDALARARGLRTTASVTLPVRLHLLGLPGARAADLTRVASHPVALAQCRAALALLPGAAVVEWYDSAGAARDVARAGDRAGHRTDFVGLVRRTPAGGAA
jgi:prephenate dehydratase